SALCLRGACARPPFRKPISRSPRRRKAWAKRWPSAARSRKACKNACARWRSAAQSFNAKTQRRRDAKRELFFFAALRLCVEFGFPCKLALTARSGTEVLTNHPHTIFFKLLVARHHGQVIQLGCGNDEAVKRIVVNRWQLRRRDADIQFEGKDGQSMVFHDLRKPRLNGMRKFQFARGCFEADFKTADGGDINRRGGVDFLERGTA